MASRAGWILILASILWLAAFGRLASIAVLMPISAIVGYAMVRAGDAQNKLPARAKRR